MTKPITAELERAEGPDRDLDARIAVASGEYKKDAGRSSFLIEVETGHAVGGWPQYTASIDTAMTLVPVPHSYDVDATAPDFGIDFTIHSTVETSEEREFKGTAKTMPLAICIAALKARGVE